MIASRYNATRIEANVKIQINNVQIKEVKKTKSLGIIIGPTFELGRAR